MENQETINPTPAEIPAIKKPKLNSELVQTKLALTAFILVALTGIFSLWLVNLNSPQTPLRQKLTDLKSNNATTTSLAVFPDQRLLARAAVVYDINNHKILFAKNAETSLPLASLTKLMTALVSAEQIPAQTLVTVPNLGPGNNPASSSLITGERWRLKDLIDFTLVSSSNEGARALALVAMSNNQNPDLTFVSVMNNRRQTLGLPELRFYNETGLDENSSLAGAYGSALAVSKLNAYLVSKHPDLIEATREAVIRPQTTDHATHLAVNTNQAINDLPGLLSSKTGYTLLAGGNLSIVFQAGLNRPIAITVLGSTQEGRFSDTNQLVWATLDYLAEEGK